MPNLKNDHIHIKCNFFNNFDHNMQIQLQSNFSGSNSFGTMKISSRQGKFEPMRVDYSARSEGLIRISV